MKFLNYVVIRFSLKLKSDWGRNAFTDVKDREAWFAMRAQIFKDYCYPSLAHQTTPAYKIFIFMDRDDTGLWEKYLALPPPFMPVFAEAGNLNNETKDLINKGPKDNVVISRIDSDDAVSFNYISCINEIAAQALANGDRKKYIVAANGFITNGETIQSIYYNSSPFVSLFVKEYSGEVIYNFNHTNILDRNPLISESAMWMQVLHGTNSYNRFRTKSRFTSEDPRKMLPGPLLPVGSAWPISFPPFVNR